MSRLVAFAFDPASPYVTVRNNPTSCPASCDCRVGFLGAWSSTHLIGIDLEDPTRNLEAAELAQQFFSKAEAKAVEELGGLACLRSFFQLWSLKEAALKSIGEGLPFSLDAFEFELTPNLRVVHAPVTMAGRSDLRGT